MTDEVRQVAERAWESMTRKPSVLDSITGAQAMPPFAAVDMVQDVTDDRGEAIRAIVIVAADDLAAQFPGVTLGPSRDNIGRLEIAFASAMEVCPYWRALDIAGAAACAEMVLSQAAFPEPPASRLLAMEGLRQWASRALAALVHCSEVLRLWPH